MRHKNLQLHNKGGDGTAKSTW